MSQLPTTLTATDTLDVEALFRAMNGLPKDQRLDVAALVGRIFDQADARTA